MVTPSSYYSRNWENITLVPSVEKDQWVKYGKLTAELVLPFISLYKPAQIPISYAFGLWNITQASYSFLQAPDKCQDAAEIAKNVAELAFTYFELRAGLIVNTTLELMQYLYLPKEKKVERLGSFISNLFYLSSLLNPFSLQWTIVSLIFHACLSLYQAYQAGKEAHQAGTYLHEKTPVAIAKGVMGITRFYQAYQSYVILKNIQALEFLLERNQEMAEETDLLIEKNGDPAETDEVIDDPSHSLQEQSSQDAPALQQPAAEEIPVEDGLGQIQRNDLSSMGPPEEEFLLNDHPLKNLVQKIEAKRVVLINPTTGEKQDFGAYFYGYGKQLVKGANLRFQYAVTEKGSHVTELHFRISEQYKERVLKHLEALHKLSPEQARQFAASLKGKNLRVEMTRVWGKKDYSDKPGALHVKGVGSLFLKPDKSSDLVKISLKGKQDIESFHQFLKAFNLEEALTVSTAEDLEKLKLNFLFKFFYPPKADKLVKEEPLFELSPEDLRQKIIEIAPAMKSHFETYQIQETEILPGFVHYSIPIDKEARALGCRALTAALLSSQDYYTEYSYTLPADNLDRITNIVKHGIFSMEMRKAAEINKEGLDNQTALNSIFTQMVWQKDVDKQKKLIKLGYTSDVRLYFSLKVLNRGSYQYNKDMAGSKQDPPYSNRKNIFDFIRYFPFHNSDAKKKHEVMIPYRILPEEIGAVNVTTPEMRQQLIAHFKKHDIIQIDSEGKETIHGVPVDNFILVGKRISPQVNNL